MKTTPIRITSIIAIIIICVSGAIAQVDTELHIKNILMDMWDAIEKKDLDRYAAHLHPDFSSFGENDMFLNEGKELEVRNARNWTAETKYIHTDMHNAKVNVRGTTAWITYYWTDYGENKDGSFSSNGKSTRIFVKEGDDWLCIHAHFTLIEN